MNQRGSRAPGRSEAQPLPVDRRLQGLHACTQVLAGLGQRLQVPDDAILNQVRGKEALRAAGRVLLDSRNAAQDVF